jgi:hypothetical protein
MKKSNWILLFWGVTMPWLFRIQNDSIQKIAFLFYTIILIYAYYLIYKKK